MSFKKFFLNEFNIPYNGEKEFDELSGLIGDLNNYIENSYKIENNILYSDDEKREILQKRYQNAQNVWQKMIHPRLERMKEMDPNNVKFLPKILTIPSPK